MLNMVVHIVTTGLQRVNVLSQYLHLGKQETDGNTSVCISYASMDRPQSTSALKLLTPNVVQGCVRILLA